MQCKCMCQSAISVLPCVPMTSTHLEDTCLLYKSAACQEKESWVQAHTSSIPMKGSPLMGWTTCGTISQCFSHMYISPSKDMQVQLGAIQSVNCFGF